MKLLLPAICLLCLAAPLRAHDGLDVEPPASAAEAWNTLNLCRANLVTLMAERQWPEIPLQATFCNQALRWLREEAAAARPALVPRFYDAEAQALQLFRVATRNDKVRTPREVESLNKMLTSLAAEYDPKVAQAAVWSCPMCRGVRELEAGKKCPKCGMDLVPRIIPASSVYNTPGEPSMTLAATGSIAPGTLSHLELRLARKKDGAPVGPGDLLVIHTERIHLLIIDESLTDYHHVHPRAEAEAGRYSFDFTPRKGGACRIFADVVPALSNVQEFIVCDVPGTGGGEPWQPAPESNQAESDGLRYVLEWENPGAPVRARQPARATVHIADARTGAPFTGLEPVMGTFAHVVAFHQDRQTVLHIHPLGVVPQKPEDRGGPAFTFQFYAPKAGEYRLFSQVQVGGEQRFAPFVVKVAE